MHTNLKQAQLAELVDALDSNSSIERCTSSILVLGTKTSEINDFRGFFIPNMSNNLISPCIIIHYHFYYDYIHYLS